MTMLPFDATSSLARRGQAAGPASTKLNATDLLPGTHRAQPDAHDALVKQTQTWVSQTFFGTLLKQMRESPFRTELFDGGRGGQAFGSMFDQRLADRMARGAGSKLVKAIVKRIEAKKAYAKQDVRTAESIDAGNSSRGAMTR